MCIFQQGNNSIHLSYVAIQSSFQFIIHSLLKMWYLILATSEGSERCLQTAHNQEKVN